MRRLAIVPTYRNLRTLPAVLEGLEAGGLPILVIDDGSDDGTGLWLEQWATAGERRWIERFAQNRGKGAALAAGIARARAMGFDVAVSVDSDGQHMVDDALRIAAAMAPGVLLIGAREEMVEGYPPKSLFGRRLWALGVRSLTGLAIADPICGLRGYPLRESASVAVTAGRYAWEEEFLVRAAWAGLEIRETQIRTVYQREGERVSHFALGDWFESMWVWARLASLRVAMLAPRYRPRGPLARRDRSWRRITGAAALVGCVAGSILPLALALPLLAWVAWRLHAPVAIAVAAGGVGAILASAWTPLVSVAIAPALAFTIARAARFLGSN